jgi:hypothetical protein
MPYDPITISTIFIAVATGVNVLATLLLWTATKSSVDIARRVFEAANRPYVGIEGIATHKYPSARKLEIDCALKNFGTAPAEEEDSEMTPYLNGVRSLATPRFYFRGTDAH